MIILIFIFINVIFSQCKFKFDNKIEQYKNKNNNKIKNIFFITLYRDKHRVANVQNLINKYNINSVSNIIKAIDGKKIYNNKELLSNYFNKRGLKLKPGEIGCALSHVMLWKYMLKLNLEYIIVFEDDVQFDKNTLNKLNDFLNNVPSDYDICQIWHHYNFKKDRRNTTSLNKYIMNGYPQWGTVGYIISNKGATKILNLIMPMYKAIDGLIKKLLYNNKIISYCPKEDIIYYNKFKFKSTIKLLSFR